MNFDEWFESQGKPKTKTWDDWWDEGEVSKLEYDKGPKYLVTCRCCDHDYAISDFITADEFDPEDRDNFYCGRSERCCP